MSKENFSAGAINRVNYVALGIPDTVRDTAIALSVIAAIKGSWLGIVAFGGISVAAEGLVLIKRELNLGKGNKKG